MNEKVERVLGKGLVVHQWLYEKTDGRIGRSLGGRPMLLLRTVGRKTGEPRTERLWAKANEVNQGQYDTYQSRTDRKIPVVVLERR